MSALPPRDQTVAGRIVPAQRCAFGDNDRGYCERPATVHLWVLDLFPDHPQGITMSCNEHCPWFDTRRHHVHDHHPVSPACGLPDTDWVFTDPAGRPGWCEIEGIDFLSRPGRAEQTPHAKLRVVPLATTSNSTVA